MNVCIQILQCSIYLLMVWIIQIKMKTVLFTSFCHLQLPPASKCYPCHCLKTFGICLYIKHIVDIGLLISSEISHNNCPTTYKVDRHHIKTVTTLGLITVHLIHKILNLLIHNLLEILCKLCLSCFYVFLNPCFINFSVFDLYRHSLDCSHALNQALILRITLTVVRLLAYYQHTVNSP